MGDQVASQQQSMGSTPSPAPSAQAVPDAETRLDAIEKGLGGEEVPVPVTALRERPDLDRTRQDLLWVARDETLPPETRARADMLLDLGFGDKAAAQRRAAVQAVIADDIRDLGRRLQAAEHEAGWRAPPLVRAMLKELLYSHPDIADDELTSLLRAMDAELAPKRPAPRDPG
ncbi:hypothetical protein [Roseospira visakhapatnamensis]|uniref:Uncharacterized protein n=1 Tax=Roseospira visakhapatnamensis TaxID=390880 RepID=A0A7W6RGC4_9PROT|nr:hypothetical protein [Roseospira visakhapatnamensis]MBB4267807.1 hypothetical protein [Roseospira visakhapatnamensis]